MKNFCVKIAEDHAIDLLRKADVRAGSRGRLPARGAGPCARRGCSATQSTPVGSSRCSLSSSGRGRCRQTASTSSRASPVDARGRRLQSRWSSKRSRPEALSPDEGHLSPAHDEAGAVAGHGALAAHRLGAAGNLSTSGGGMKAPEKIVHGPANSLIRNSGLVRFH